MAIIASDIKVYLSGGAGNAVPSASLGGAISATELTDNSLHNLFDIVGSSEASAGDIEYRCLYVKNTHGTLSWQSAKAWISTQSTTTVSIALVTEGLNGVASTKANESTVPGETFTTPVSEGTGLSLGTMAPGDFFGVRVRRTVPSSQAAVNDTAVLSFKGDTAA